LPPPLRHASHPISPELALIDRDLATLAFTDETDERLATRATGAFLENDARDAMLRICELSDVNPPRRRGLMLAVAVSTLLWTEVVLVVASLVPFSAL
jgi:hypothetical protein